jgi:putative ABC transport system permease protein
MRLVSGWRLALRLAWREAWRAKGRSAVVLVMVTFPVVAVVAADVAQATSSVSHVEGLSRQMGAAAAEITMGTGQPSDEGSGHHDKPAPIAQIVGALGSGPRTAIRLRVGGLGVRTRLGVLYATATAVDGRSPLAKGLFRLTSGRLPSASDEVDVNNELVSQGYAIGDSITEADGTRLRIVGTAEDATSRTTPYLLGSADLPMPTRDAGTSWLVGGPPVSRASVHAAERLGAEVTSRQVEEHPTKAEQALAGESSDRAQLYPALVLIGVMALTEVVLLAGPAFAVGARRQSRSLALISANGGTPAQSRRVVLGTAMVIGTFAGVAGIGLGIGLARLLLPLLQTMSDSYFGPFQVRWEHVLGAAALGLLSALLAAVVPAWVASRQDVVAVLAGRRGDRAASLRSPVLGLVLVACGVVVAVLGSRRDSSELLIAGAAVLTIFGMVLVVPVVVIGVARLGRRMPLPLRYAVRDAARHRTRTVPAVAAVAATVAGLVALAIGTSSQEARARADYTPTLPVGESSISLNGGHVDVHALEMAVIRVAPLARPSAVVGVQGNRELETGNGSLSGMDFVSSLPLQALVSDGVAQPGLTRPQLSDAEWTRVSPTLRAGGVVTFGTRDAAAGHAVIRLHGRPGVRVPSVTVGVGTASPPAGAILAPQVAKALGLPVKTVGVLVTGPPLTTQQESDLRQVLAGTTRASYLYTERGYQESGEERVVLWILYGLAAVLMVGGTLTATFLALSDARPDLATLSAVGAPPLLRRAVAAAYAVSVGLLGALLGAAVGLVPGIAVSYPLTRTFGEAPGPAHYLSIPWLEIGAVVLALPLLTALVVGLLARSRLPLVARLD